MASVHLQMCFKRVNVGGFHDLSVRLLTDYQNHLPVVSGQHNRGLTSLSQGFVALCSATVHGKVKSIHAMRLL